MKMKYFLAAISLGCLATLLAVPAIAGSGKLKRNSSKPEVRTAWVTRWDYKTPEDIKKIIKNVSEYNFNTLVFQVRGNATAFYASEIEPWAWELTGDDPSTLGTDPGWDPLEVACKEAHDKGIELHAWMNVLPAWKQTTPPPEDSNHLWNTHRDWFMQAKDGTVMWPHDWWDYWYTFIDPGVPEVRQYLHDVFLEVATKYPVDGLHYDYIRYPYEAGDYAYNATCVQRFKDAYHVESIDEKPVQWNEWKRTQITNLAQSIYFDVNKVNKDIKISASILYDWPRAHNDYCQDSRTWLSRGVIDMTVPMLYIDNQDRFAAYVRDLVAHNYGRWIVPNIDVTKFEEPEELLEMIDLARKLGTDGIGIYNYFTIFPDHKPNEKADALLAGPFAKRVKTPKMSWKED